MLCEVAGAAGTGMAQALLFGFVAFAPDRESRWLDGGVVLVFPCLADVRGRARGLVASMWTSGRRPRSIPSRLEHGGGVPATSTFRRMHLV